jgi:hypothetical protein
MSSKLTKNDSEGFSNRIQILKHCEQYDAIWHSAASWEMNLQVSIKTGLTSVFFVPVFLLRQVVIVCLNRKRLETSLPDTGTSLELAVKAMDVRDHHPPKSATARFGAGLLVLPLLTILSTIFSARRSMRHRRRIIKF